jgi:hypothetical protein
LLERAQLIRQAKAPADKLLLTTPILKPGAQFSVKTKIGFCNRLGEDWKLLADYLEITPAEQRRFKGGDEGRNIWEWLDNPDRLGELPDILTEINLTHLKNLFISKP